MRTIQVRVTASQYLRIQNRKEAFGYLQLSAFLRDLLLKEDLVTYELIRDIHDKVCVGTTASRQGVV